VHVLVVDDNADARVIYKDLLTYAGASVVTCSSATAAVKALRHVRPDVIISDLAMPRKDGLWLIDWIRKRDARVGTSIPAIAITARDDLYPQTSPELKGFDAYLAKPVEPRQLFSTISRFVRSANAPGVSAASA
jgi:CheY-like chemotaxis protein